MIFIMLVLLVWKNLMYKVGMKQFWLTIQKIRAELKRARSGDFYVTWRFIEDLKEMFLMAEGRGFLRVVRKFCLIGEKVRFLLFLRQRKQINERFVKKRMDENKEFFDSAAAFPLDEQQRRAVVVDENNNLVIAGAGSGKTMTIVAKIKYLVKKCGVRPSEILPVSFTQKSALEMQERIGVKGVRPKTFHAFGLSVISQVEGKLPEIFDSGQLPGLMQKWVMEMAKDVQFLSKLVNFLVNYLKIPKEKHKFRTKKAYFDYVNREEFGTILGERVFSPEKAILANFFVMNGVKYELEKRGRDGKILADFVVCGKIYIDVVDVGKNSPVIEFLRKTGESEAGFLRRFAKIREKRRRKIEKMRGVYVEILAEEIVFDGEVVNVFVEKLERAGVCFECVDIGEIWGLMQKNMKGYIDEFLRLVQTFLGLARGIGYEVDELRVRNVKMRQNRFLRRRAEKFLEIFEQIYKKYTRYLEKIGKVDFDEMVIRAIKYIENGEYDRVISYVIVDEFQDLSFGRYKILRAIRRANVDVKFFCVGDDWQAIYRFAGSDVGLFVNFEKYFGRAEISRIETTYRFCEPMIGISSGFVLKNPEQVNKKIRAGRGARTELFVIKNEKLDCGLEEVVIKIQKWCVDNGRSFGDVKIFVLGRYGFDVQKIVGEKFSLCGEEIVSKKFDCKMNFVTVHKSKGLEADFVVLINAENGCFGFPSGRDSDPILNLVLGEGEEYEDAEERRLFYVAITRAKLATFVLVKNENRASGFVSEIKDFMMKT